MFDIEATHARELDAPDRWLSEARRTAGLGQGYERGAGPSGPVDDHLERTRAQLAADRSTNPAGAFTKLRMTLAPEWHEAVRNLDPDAAGRRMLEAAKRVISWDLPRHQGVLTLVRDGRDSMPAVQAVLSPRLRDGGTAPLLGRAEIARLEARWDRAVQVTFGLTRNLEPALRPAPPRELELRGEMDRAVKRFMDVMGARMRGEVGQEELRSAAAEAERAAHAYRGAHVEAAPRRMDPVPVSSEPTRRFDPARLRVERPERMTSDVLRLRVEGGRHYLRGIAPEDVKAVVRQATEAALARAGLHARVETFCWNTERDLQVFLVFNHRPMDAVREVEPHAASAALTTHLRADLAEKVAQHDTRRMGPVGELGRVELLEPGKEPERAPGEPVRRGPPDPVDAFDVHLRLARGTEYLTAVPPEKREDVVRAAVERAFPFLTERHEAVRFSMASEGNALRVRVTVPSRSGWTRDQLERPLFQFRFAHEIQRAYVVHGGGRTPLAPLPSRGQAGGVLRSIGRGALGAADVTRAVQAPARTLAESALFSRIPSPLRAVRSISRALGFFRQQDE